MGSPNRFIWWLLRKLGLTVLLAGLVLGGLGWWNYRHDRDDFAAHHRERDGTLAADIRRIMASLGATDARMAATRVKIAALQERAVQAGKVAGQLAEMSSGLNRLTNDSAQQKENEERQARMQLMQTNSLKQAAELAQNLIHIQWEKDGMEIALARKQQDLLAIRSDRSKAQHYLRTTWETYGRWVLLGVTVLALGPVVWPGRRDR